MVALAKRKYWSWKIRWKSFVHLVLVEEYDNNINDVYVLIQYIGRSNHRMHVSDMFWFIINFRGLYKKLLIKLFIYFFLGSNEESLHVPLSHEAKVFDRKKNRDHDVVYLCLSIFSMKKALYSVPFRLSSIRCFLLKSISYSFVPFDWRYECAGINW